MKVFNKISFLFIIIIFFLNPILLFSQQLISQFSIKSGFSFTSNIKGINYNLPFWHHSNKNGSIDKNSANINKYLSFKTEIYSNDIMNLKFESKFINRLASSSSTHLEISFIELESHNFDDDKLEKLLKVLKSIT